MAAACGGGEEKIRSARYGNDCHLSDKCSVNTSIEGPCVKFSKMRNEGVSMVSFSTVYWSIFMENWILLKNMLDEKTSHVIHGGTFKNMENDRGYARLEVGFWDYKGDVFWHVGLHFENESRQRIKGGLNLSPEEFENLVAFAPQIERQLEDHRREKGIKRKGEDLVFRAPAPKMVRITPAPQGEDMNKIMSSGNIRNNLVRYRRPAGRYSQWRLFKEMCVEDVEKEFPDLDPNDFEYSELEIQNGGLAEVIQLILCALLMVFTQKRAEKICPGCNMNLDLMDRNVIDDPEKLIEDACEKSCSLPLAELAKRHWAIVKPMITAEHAAVVCVRFLGMYGPKYRFRTEQLLSICAVGLTMCTPSLISDKISDERDDRECDIGELLQYGSGNFTDAVDFIERTIEREK